MLFNHRTKPLEPAEGDRDALWAICCLPFHSINFFSSNLLLLLYGQRPYGLACMYI